MTRTQAEHHCHACRGRVELERKPGRRDDCPHCGAELHACLNCALYDPNLSRGCREPQADDVREKERANFCGWFEFRQGSGDEADPGEAARAAAAAFFGGGMEKKSNPMRGLLDAREAPAPNPMARFFEPERKDGDAEREKANDAFDGLLGRKK